LGKVVEFVVILDNGVRKRHRREVERGEVLSFAVQLEVLVGDEWKPVVRYDSSHEFAHTDLFTIDGRKKKIPLDLGFSSSLTLADWDINENWEEYVRNFLRGGKRK
jgi:hypothetical protein